MNLAFRINRCLFWITFLVFQFGGIAFAQDKTQQKTIDEAQKTIRHKNNKGQTKDVSGNTLPLNSKKFQMKSKNAMTGSHVPQVVDDPGSTKDLMKKSSAVTSKDQVGNSLRLADKKFRMRSGNAATSNHNPAIVESPGTAKEQMKKSSAVTSKDQVGNSVRLADKKYMLRLSNAGISNFQPGAVESPTSRKKIEKESNAQISQFESSDVEHYINKKYRMRLDNYQFSTFQPGFTESVDSRKEKMAQKSEEIAASNQGNTLSREEHKSMMAAKNEELKESDKNMLNIDLKARDKKIENRSREISGSTKGNTLGREEHKSMMAAKNEELKESEKTMLNIDLKARDKKIENRSREMSGSTKGNTLGREEYKSMMAAKNEELKESEKTMLNIDLKARDKKIENRSREMSGSTKGNTLGREEHKSMMAAKNEELKESEKTMLNIDLKARDKKIEDRSREMSGSTKGNTLGREEHKSMMAAKNEELKESEKTMLNIDLKARDKKIENRSREMSGSTKGNTLGREEHKAMMAAKNEELNESKKGMVTMNREAYRKKLKEKNQVITASQKGNTLGRDAQREMMKNKSEEIAGQGKNLVTSSGERKGQAREKSKAISEYKAGYLNSAAERKARIRSFFYPGQYQANTPTEKVKKMREKSSKIASYEGEIKRRKYDFKMHPSSRYLGKFQLASMSERGAFREKTARELAKSKKSYLPNYLKERPQKPRYDRNVEKGIWAD